MTSSHQTDNNKKTNKKQRQSKQKNDPPTFSSKSQAMDGAKHSIGITSNGIAYTWGKHNALGQLGRITTDNNKQKIRCPHPVILSEKEEENQNNDTSTKAQAQGAATAIRGYVGGSSESGHTAILDSTGYLWLTGCDRWQQLGLGSPHGGSAGYTWENGKLWQTSFRKNVHLYNLMKQKRSGGPSSSDDEIRDVALGWDHTVVLSSNQRDVYVFGKGGDGQLGLVGKPFVSAPVRSAELSLPSSSSSSRVEENSKTNKDTDIAAVCAIRHCSITLNDSGDIMNKVGKCSKLNSMDEMKKSFKACVGRAKRDGLIR